MQQETTFTIHQMKERAEILIKGMGDAIISTEESVDERNNEEWVKITLKVRDCFDVLNLIHSGVRMGMKI